MSEDAWQVIGLSMVVILTLVATVYGWVVWEQRRLSKNLHGLREMLQRVIVALASRGIAVRSDDDERS